MSYHTFEEYKVMQQIQESMVQIKEKGEIATKDFQQCTSNLETEKEKFNSKMKEIEPTNQKLKGLDQQLKACKEESSKFKL